VFCYLQLGKTIISFLLLPEYRVHNRVNWPRWFFEQLTLEELPMIRRSVSVWFVVLFLIATLHAQTQPVTTASLANSSTPARPKIGLVLSGGGARGWAHVGVLRWFEEHHIPVDYIAGTSMGALVGAMYAMGSSPNEIREIGSSLDWDKALSGPPSFYELSYRRKEDQRAYPSDLELGAGKDGISLPSGINPGHNIGLIFDRLTLPYATLRDFDELPIPFRCVATDMLEATPVVFKSGPLSKALRATMSIPGCLLRWKSTTGFWLMADC